MNAGLDRDLDRLNAYRIKEGTFETSFSCSLFITFSPRKKISVFEGFFKVFRPISTGFLTGFGRIFGPAAHPTQREGSREEQR